jgi:hypothetical protein
MLIFQESFKKTSGSGSVGFSSKTLLYGLLIGAAVIAVLYVTKNDEKI